MDLTLGGSGNTTVVLDNSRENSLDMSLGAIGGDMLGQTGGEGSQGGLVSVLTQMILQMNKQHRATMDEVMESTRGTKRSREDEDKDLAKSKPVMIHIKKHAKEGRPCLIRSQTEGSLGRTNQPQTGRNLT